MSVKIKITKAIGGHKEGDTIQVTPRTAEFLTSVGVVDEGKKASGRASKDAAEGTQGGTPSA